MKKLPVALLLILMSVSSFAWAPVGDKIKTKWAAEVDPSAPRPEYPRPQMVRSEWINLNGLWDYGITAQDASYSKADGKILVPFCVESSLSGVGRKVSGKDALWYERQFALPQSWGGQDVLLHFGAVDWKAEVWVNGKYVGEHCGGYAPFCFNIRPFLKKGGRQVLRVKVTDGTDNSLQPRGKQAEAPCTIWYTPVTGIWQTVWMEPVCTTRIKSYNPVYAGGKFNLEIEAENLQETDIVRASLIEGGTGYCAEKPGKTVLKTAQGCKVDLTPDVLNLWSTQTPYLYGLRIEIERNGKTIDAVDGYAALRSVRMVKDPKPDRFTNSFKRIGINSKREFFFGPLDQGYWPDGLYTAPTEAAMKYDLEKIKDFGWNLVRKHMKVEPARWYYWCDVLGLTVWQDMPSIGDRDPRKPRETRSDGIVKVTKNVWERDYVTFGGTDCEIPSEWKENFYKEWGEIIDALKPFQCITVWTPFNEAWGQFDTEKVVEFTRAKDPTRLINEASGGNFTGSGDILAPHHYASPAVHAFSSKYINVLAEYGGLGCAVKGHLWNEGDNFQYGKAFKTGEDVLQMYEKFIDMMIPMVENGISAAVYTEITDVEVEVNGIMTYDREIVKLNENRLRELNQKLIRSALAPSPRPAKPYD